MVAFDGIGFTTEICAWQTDKERPAAANSIARER
jgi:hypothetical protein